MVDIEQDGEDLTPLFLANKLEGVGIIRNAEIRATRATRRRYIRAEVTFGETDDTVCVIGRMVYSQTVIRYGLPVTVEAEEANVEWMIGKPIRVKWEHRKMIDGVIYVNAVVLGIGA